jgi:hypothetical protein
LSILVNEKEVVSGNSETNMRQPTMLPFNKRGRALYQGMLFRLGMGWIGVMGSRDWSEKAGARGKVALGVEQLALGVWDLKLEIGVVKSERCGSYLILE